MGVEQENVSVLISGGGPTGLMVACQLVRQGISFRLIDKNPGATTQSRALVLHARSMEIFQQMGIVEKILAVGEVCHGMTWMFNGKEAAEWNLIGDDLTEFPYILCLEQSKTEELLIDYLAEAGHRVERSVELLDYSVDEQEKVTAKLKKADGTEEILQVDYLIGADGTHSIVREKMGLHMEGSTYLQTLFVIDCQVKADIEPHKIYIMFSKKGLTGFFPMVQFHDKADSGQHRYRVLGILPASEKDKVITFDEIQKDFSTRVGMPAEIHDPAWVSTYHAHHRHAKVFRVGPCFLAGDAAHIHSPVGGQGMNTGLQDAYNLVWKLSLVIKGKAQKKLLDTYNDERIVIADKLVHTTDKAFYIAAGESPFMKVLRLKIFPWLVGAIGEIFRHSKRASQAVFKVASQLGVNYRYSKLAQGASWGNFLKNIPEPGDRMPCVFFQDNDQKKNIQDYLQGIQFHLFVFSKTGCDENKLLSLYIEKYQDLIVMHYIPYTTETDVLYKTFGITQEGYYLVRPDMYIAYRSSSLNIEPLTKYLAKFF